MWLAGGDVPLLRGCRPAVELRTAAAFEKARPSVLLALSSQQIVQHENYSLLNGDAS